ncbi:MAG: DUF222 domain-containing protein, partial [Actinomycetota bacterium]
PLVSVPARLYKEHVFDAKPFELGPMEAADSGLEDRLSDTNPGAALATLLEGINRSHLGESDRVVLLQARARLLSHIQAELYADMVSVGEAVAEAIGGHDPEFEADEVRAALVLTRRAAEEQMALAQMLVERFPRLWQALWSGRLDTARVRVIVGAVAGLRAETATLLVDDLLPAAAGMTTGQLRAGLARLVIAVDPQAAADRYREGVKGRRVWAGANPDGTAGLFGFDLPADRVAAALSRIHRLARNAGTAQDPRTADQIRADVFMDLLCGEATGTSGRRGMVDLRVDLTTLAGLDEHPAEIPGWGPVIADIARQIAAEQTNTTWQVTVTGAEGQVVWTGTTRRRPDRAMRRQVEATRTTCVFPGCRMPARQTDLDHTRAWTEGGQTHPDNLAPLCRHDHRLKHQAGWKLQPTRPSTWTWTSPLGRTYQVVTAPP